MILQYTGTVSDLSAKLDYFAGQSSIARHFTKAAYICICGLMWLTVWRFYVEQRHINSHYLVAGACALLLTCLLPWLYKLYQTAFFASILTTQMVSGLIGDTKIILSESEVTEERENIIIRARWSELKDMVVSAQHYFLVIAPLIVITIPFHIFANDAERQRFETLVNQRRSTLGAHKDR